MATKNRPNALKNIVFMSSSFFCSFSYDSYEAIARKFNVREELIPFFCHSIGNAMNHLYLNYSTRITKEVMAKAFDESPLLPRCLRTFHISSKEIVEALEDSNLYEYKKDENYSKTLETIKYLYGKGYNLILRDDKPESVLTEALKQAGLLEYFKSVQGLIGNYPSFSKLSMLELMGESNPGEFLIVTYELGKTNIIKNAKQFGIPVFICKDFDISKLKEIL